MSIETTQGVRQHPLIDLFVERLDIHHSVEEGSSNLSQVTNNKAMGYLNKVCHYNRDGKSYTGTIIGQKGEEDFLLITVAPFAHNHTSYDKCIEFGFVLSIDKDDYIKQSKNPHFYFI